jgi:dihydroneopterin aldolase/2-amino-4-hydroxy-6-hydroxymethyldihydropteridine diphosphokinase/dihydropteroate synthase/2-amino-4-hydroxy-6-hydroxymethyldihydropteridine diphosphokinase/dihydropteroate synthase
MLELLKITNSQECAIKRVFPVGDKVWNFNEKVYMMGILNVTPDSFSDGGKSETLDFALRNAGEMAKVADIIDIGGQSTAPGAIEVSEEEEIQRVVPVIEGIRRINKTIPISVDTYRATVAEAAVAAGANLINDVSGGDRSPEMLGLMGRLAVPVCLMHMRGNSETMMGLTDYKSDLISSIKDELSKNVHNALCNGVYRWNILVDPGIGFAKNTEQNYEIIRNLQKLVCEGKLKNFPILVGPSRKKFIGEATAKPFPVDRVWGTAGAAAASILNGASVIRVHDVMEMKDVILVANLCRVNSTSSSF